jgi:hypothetical protein
LFDLPKPDHADQCIRCGTVFPNLPFSRQENTLPKDSLAPERAQHLGLDSNWNLQDACCSEGDA